MLKQALGAAAAALLTFTSLSPAALAAAPRPQACEFTLGFKTLHEALPDVVGDCKNQPIVTDAGDVQQGTVNGLLVWRKADSVTIFTDGFKSWLNGPLGLQQRLNGDHFSWEPGASPATPRKSGAFGYDVSYPQCSRSGPPPGVFGAIGVTGGRPFSTNACAAAEFGWAARNGTPDLYMNTGFLDAYKAHISSACRAAAPAAMDPGLRDAWAMGCSEAEQAAANQPGSPAMWWLDVETENSWSNIQVLNQKVIQGAIDELRQQGPAPVGVYSTPRMWPAITGGGWTPAGLAGAWLATGHVNAGNAASFCGTRFTGAPNLLVQFVVGGYDADYAC